MSGIIKHGEVRESVDPPMMSMVTGMVTRAGMMMWQG